MTVPMTPEQAIAEARRQIESSGRCPPVDWNKATARYVTLAEHMADWDDSLYGDRSAAVKKLVIEQFGKDHWIVYVPYNVSEGVLMLPAEMIVDVGKTAGRGQALNSE